MYKFPKSILNRLYGFFKKFGGVNQFKKIILFFFVYNLIVFLILSILNFTNFGKMLTLPYSGILGTSRWIGMLFGIFFLNSIFLLDWYQCFLEFQLGVPMLNACRELFFKIMSPFQGCYWINETHIQNQSRRDEILVDFIGNTEIKPWKGVIFITTGFHPW